jgi:dTDP-4-dehydrorhamnose reductase
MSKKIIILGVNGMAGHILFKDLKEKSSGFHVIGVARSISPIEPTVILDITNFDLLKRLIEKECPDIIINCIGLLNATAENNPDQAILVNSYLPHYLEGLTRNSKTKIIHISTDCVFSGNEGSYLESTIKNGVGYYSLSKSLGEIINSKDLTFRTSIIGPELNNNGIGLFNWIANQENEVLGFEKAFWTGVTTIELLHAVKHAIREDLTGLYHLVFDHKISKFDLLNIINQEFSLCLKVSPNDKYVVDKSLINTRRDFGFKVKSYELMIKEMHSWILMNKELYPHYRGKLF